jgi:DNA-binding response OmpR family regulator
MPRILLVEDDLNVRPLMEHIMVEHGYQVTTAESVATGTALISSQPFDLVICDVKLSDGNGLSVAERARTCW